MQVLASQLHFLANKNAELAIPPLFWPVNCIKIGGYVALLSDIMFIPILWPGSKIDPWGTLWTIFMSVDIVSLTKYTCPYQKCRIQTILIQYLKRLIAVILIFA